jgi:hypothetical protein
MTTAMTRATIAIVRVSMARPYSVSRAVSPDPPGGTPLPPTDGFGGVSSGSSQALARDEQRASSRVSPHALASTSLRHCGCHARRRARGRHVLVAGHCGLTEPPSATGTAPFAVRKVPAPALRVRLRRRGVAGPGTCVQREAECRLARRRVAVARSAADGDGRPRSPRFLLAPLQPSGQRYRLAREDRLAVVLVLAGRSLVLIVRHGADAAQLITPLVGVSNLAATRLGSTGIAHRASFMRRGADATPVAAKVQGPRQTRIRAGAREVRCGSEPSALSTSRWS